MIDLRLWRTALLPVPLVLLVAMFSLQETPRALEPVLPPDAFDGDAAATLASDLVAAHPGAAPGSEQDAALADAVVERFETFEAGQLSEQRFSGSLDGDEVELRNVIMVLPGQSERQVALLAPRDSLGGSGAASGVASTAALLEIAAGLAGSTHEKTLVFVSTDGSAAGAAGARRFARDYSDADVLDAAVVLSRPAAENPRPPLVIPWSSGPQSSGAQLVETARALVSEEVGRPPGDESPLRELLRLALPAALGEQGPLIESGIDAVRLSSGGELPLPASEDEADDVDAETLARFGRAALGVVLALDAAREPSEHGPDAYISLAGSLLPGWTLSLLALALLLPVAAVAGAGLARSAPSPTLAARALGWAALRVVPFGLAVALLYALAITGGLPSPDFPFDPAREDLGVAGTISVGTALIAFALLAFLLRPLLAPPAALARVAPAAALGLAALAGLGIWAVNPYLGLLTAVGLQALVPAAAGVGGGRPAAAGFVALACVPGLIALADLAARFDAGAGVLWDLVFLFSGEQLTVLLVPLGCVLGGAAFAILAANGEPLPPGSQQLNLQALIARGRELEERRGAGRPRGRDEPPAEEQPWREDQPRKEPPPRDGEPAAGEPPPGGPQEEPARDPRIWSKPDASTARPWASITTTPSPFTT
ncbi:MAG: M28 family peptidase [Solirubrobacterales bacterium]